MATNCCTLICDSKYTAIVIDSANPNSLMPHREKLDEARVDTAEKIDMRLQSPISYLGCRFEPTVYLCVTVVVNVGTQCNAPTRIFAQLSQKVTILPVSSDWRAPLDT